MTRKNRARKKAYSETMLMARAKGKNRDYFCYWAAGLCRTNIISKMAAESWARSEYRIVRVKITELKPRKGQK